MIITFSGRITPKDDDVDEKLIYAVFRRFLTEQFRDFEFAVSGRQETIRYKSKNDETKK